jgi:peptide/nickel transport system permease protein
MTTQVAEPVRLRRPDRWLRRTFAAPQAWVGLVVLAAVVLWAALGPMLAPHDAVTADPSAFGRPPSADHWFGTNAIGQDLYAQTLLGLRTSLAVGFVAAPLATAIGALVGSVAGYAGGWVDRVLVWLIDLAIVLPSLYLLLLVSPRFGRASWLAEALAIAVFGWMVMARVVRSQARALRGRDFVRAAVYAGLPASAVVRRHVLPHIASLLVVDVTVGVGAAVLTEATLGWVGLGVSAPAVSLGTLLAAGSPAALTRPWLFFFPAGALVVTVLATSLLGDAVRDALDPRSAVTRD